MNRLRNGLMSLVSWLVCYLVIVFAGTVSAFGFYVLNRTHVFGARNRGPQSRLMIVSNHKDSRDSFLIGLVTCFPWLLWKPHLMPYNLADAREGIDSWLLRFVYRTMRVIPVHRDATGQRHDHAAYLKACEVLNDEGVVHVYPEGTRSISEELSLPQPQVGAMALATGATVRPVYYYGRFCPYRKYPGDPPITWLRPVFGENVEWLLDLRTGQLLIVIIGEDITPVEILAMAGDGDHRERNCRVAEGIMERIRILQQRCLTDIQHAA